MKRVVSLITVLLLSSCVPAPVAESSLTTTPTSVVLPATFTFVPPTATLTSGPPTPTATIEVCNPRLVDYCITDGGFIFQRPVKSPANTYVDVTYRYASTANGTRDPHHGVEFYNKYGTPVYAAGKGTVVFAGPDQEAIYSPWQNYYGNLVVIRHAGDVYTLYAHLSKITVEAGKNILAGDQIGEVGQSGVAIGSHLHFEVRRGDAQDYFSTLNPELWLLPNTDANGQPFGALQIAVLDPNDRLVKRAEFTLQQFDAQNQPSANIVYGVTYSADMLQGDENAGMSDLPTGKYRLVVQYNGQHLERWVAVESGKLTEVTFLVQ